MHQGRAAAAASLDEYGADVGDLTTFVDHGRSLVGRLREVMDDVEQQRRAALWALGSGVDSPSALSSPVMKELVAEAELVNEWADAVRVSLLSPDTAPHLQLSVPPLEVGDGSLASDRGQVLAFRRQRLVAAGLDAEEASALAHDGEAVAAALQLLVVGARPGVVATAPTVRLTRVAEAVGAGVVSGAETVEGLLGDSYGVALHQAVLSGRVPPPDDDLRRRLVAAMEQGLHPDQTPIAEVYFPWSYRRARELDRRTADLEARREEADGRSWFWWDNDEAALAEIDSELDEVRDRWAELEASHGFGPDRRVTWFDAVTAVAGATGGSRWEGQTYGAAFERHHDDTAADGDLFGPKRGSLASPEGFADELVRIGDRVAADPEVAVAFYNTLGVGKTADLATFVVGNGLAGPALDSFARGLGSASRVEEADGSPRLAFGGDDLLGEPRTELQSGVVGYSPALLFTAGRFDRRFLSDAAVAALRLADDGDPRGHDSHWGLLVEPTVLLPIMFDINGGEDPRNILLSRAAGDPAVAREVLAGLGGSLDSLLRPSVPFEPTLGPDHERHWLDRLLDIDNISGPDHSLLGPAGYPALADAYPITAFLDTVGRDDELARRVILAVAAASEDGDVVQDPGTAAGLDLILARHATVMFEPGDLAAVGIERTGLNEGWGDGVGASQWKAVHREVLRFGRGQALAVATDELLSRSIDGAIDDEGRFQAGLTRPFAHMAGRTEAEAHEALFAYSAQLDDEARRRNRQANLAASTATGGLGLVSGIGLTGIPASLAWAWFFDGYPTDTELVQRRSRWLETQTEDKLGDWEQRQMEGFLDARRAQGPNGDSAIIEAFVPNLGRSKVMIRRSGEDGRGDFVWLHPETGDWSQLPRTSVGEFNLLFRRHDEEPTEIWLVVSDARIVYENFRDGRLVGVGQRPPDLDPEDWRDAMEDARWTGEWLGSVTDVD